MEESTEIEKQKKSDEFSPKNPKTLRKEVTVELVRRLMIKGVRRAEEIQATLAQQNPPVKVTVRAIYRYKAIIRRRHAEKVAKTLKTGQSLEDTVFKLQEEIDEVLRELWKTYHACGPEDASAKVQALRAIHNISDKWVEKMQSLGLLYKAPDKHQMLDADGNPTDPTVTVNVEQLNQQFVGFIKAQWQDPIIAPPAPQDNKP